MSTTLASARITRKTLVVFIALVLITWRGLWLYSPYQTSEPDTDAINDPLSEPRHRHATNATSRIAKVTVAINALNSTILQRALRTHEVHNNLHGYQHFVGNHTLIIEATDPKNRPVGTWSKPAYLLSLLLQELNKPAAARLDWLFWFDVDSIILNPYTKLEAFLPPINPSNRSDPLNDIHLLLTSNWDGINTGIFPIRVHPWSVSLLTAMLSYPHYHSYEWLPFMDQTALSRVITDLPSFRGNWTVVPHRWFNSFPINSALSSDKSQLIIEPMTPQIFDDDEKIPEQQPWKVMKGDMALSFAGGSATRTGWMDLWVERAETCLPEWASPVTQERMQREVARFWDEERVKLRERKNRLEEQKLKDIGATRARLAEELKRMDEEEETRRRLTMKEPSLELVRAAQRKAEEETREKQQRKGPPLDDMSEAERREAEEESRAKRLKAWRIHQILGGHGH